MGKAKPLIHKILGAPFSPGQTVTVLTACDETCDRSFIGKSGEVIYLEYSCGSGQTYPADPMIGVELPSGDCEEFWREELQLNAGED